MKKSILLSLVGLLLLSYRAFSQQEFKSSYDFKPLLNNTAIKLYQFDAGIKDYKLITPSNANLKGTIKSISEYQDTIEIRLWPWPKNTAAKDGNYLTDKDNRGKYKLIIDWDNITANKIKIDYTGWQLFATTIPLRVNLKDGTFSSDFINANASFSRVHGQTKIYKSEFIEPRTRYWGYGGFVGLGGAKSSTGADILGVNYGANFVFSVWNFNLLIAGGLESGLGKNGTHKPFVGFGFGFDLFEFTNSAFTQK